MPEVPDIFAIFPELKRSGRTSLYAHEIARALGVTTQHVLNLIEDGKIKALDVSRNNKSRAAVRIPIGEYERYVATAIYDPLAAKPVSKQGELNF